MFLVYLRLSNYVFHVLVRDSSEDSVASIVLPQENAEIFHSLTPVSGPRAFRVYRRGLRDVVELSGRAFHGDIDDENRLFYLVLKSDSGPLILSVNRGALSLPGFTVEQEGEGQRDRVGFRSTFPAYHLRKSDVHQVGFVIQDSAGKHFMMTDHYLVQNDDRWQLLLLQPYVLGSRARFAQNKLASFGHYLVFGFGEQEQAFRWTVGDRARILLPQTNYDGGDLLLQVTAFPYLAGGEIDRQVVDVSVNNQHLAEWVMDTGKKTYAATVPAQMIGEGGRLDIVFDINNPASPSAFGHSADERNLGIAFHDLIVSEVKDFMQIDKKDMP